MAVSGGSDHCLALKSDGTVWAWGANTYGQLGDNTTTTRPTPVQVSGLSNIIAISAAQQASIALAADGTIWVWGQYQERLGIENADNAFPLVSSPYYYRTTPIRISSVNDIVDFSANDNTSLAVRRDGAAWAAGWNGSGMLGVLGLANNSLVNYYLQVSNISDVINLAAGENHSLAVTRVGDVWSWGSGGQWPDWLGRCNDK